MHISWDTLCVSFSKIFVSNIVVVNNIPFWTIVGEYNCRFLLKWLLIQFWFIQDKPSCCSVHYICFAWPFHICPSIQTYQHFGVRYIVFDNPRMVWLAGFIMPDFLMPGDFKRLPTVLQWCKTMIRRAIKKFRKHCDKEFHIECQQNENNFKTRYRWTSFRFALQWHYMNILTSRITYNSIVCFTPYSD